MDFVIFNSMPVEKFKRNMPPPSGGIPPAAEEFAKKILFTLVGILLVYGVVFLGTLIRNNIRSYETIGNAPKPERTISVEGEGKVTVAPDTGVVRMGVIFKGDTISAVQGESDKTIAGLIMELKKLGIPEADIQTVNYRIYPKIVYTQEKGEEQRGFEASQSITVKIRDLSKASAVLELVSKFDINDVQGVDFLIDDPDVYLEQARDLAFAKAETKARRLSDLLGVRLVSVVSYNEYDQGSSDFVPLYAERGGFGGALPAIEQGSMDVIMRVNITYEIR